MSQYNTLVFGTIIKEELVSPSYFVDCCFWREFINFQTIRAP